MTIHSLNNKEALDNKVVIAVSLGQVTQEFERHARVLRGAPPVIENGVKWPQTLRTSLLHAITKQQLALQAARAGSHYALNDAIGIPSKPPYSLVAPSAELSRLVDEGLEETAKPLEEIVMHHVLESSKHVSDLRNLRLTKDILPELEQAGRQAFKNVLTVMTDPVRQADQIITYCRANIDAAPRISKQHKTTLGKLLVEAQGNMSADATKKENIAGLFVELCLKSESYEEGLPQARILRGSKDRNYQVTGLSYLSKFGSGSEQLEATQLLNAMEQPVRISDQIRSLHMQAMSETANLAKHTLEKIIGAAADADLNRDTKLLVIDAHVRLSNLDQSQADHHKIAAVKLHLTLSVRSNAINLPAVEDRFLHDNHAMAPDIARHRLATSQDHVINNAAYIWEITHGSSEQQIARIENVGSIIKDIPDDCFNSIVCSLIRSIPYEKSKYFDGRVISNMCKNDSVMAKQMSYHSETEYCWYPKRNQQHILPSDVLMKLGVLATPSSWAETKPLYHLAHDRFGHDAIFAHGGMPAQILADMILEIQDKYKDGAQGKNNFIRPATLKWILENGKVDQKEIAVSYVKSAISLASSYKLTDNTDLYYRERESVIKVYRANCELVNVMARAGVYENRGEVNKALQSIHHNIYKPTIHYNIFKQKDIKDYTDEINAYWFGKYKKSLLKTYDQCKSDTLNDLSQYAPEKFGTYKLW